MRTVPEATKTVIERSRYLVEAISKGLINYSSLARYIRPEIESMLVKDVSEASILMAIKRFEETLKTPRYENVFKSPPNIIVRSNLCMVVVENSYSMHKKYPELLKLTHLPPKHFLITSQGTHEISIIASNDINSSLKQIIHKEKIVSEVSNLSSISIRIPQQAIYTPGVYYFLLKSLAWGGINIFEVISSNLEINIIVSSEDINETFSILQSLFTEK